MDTSKFFDYYYSNAEVNSILIMNLEGIILDVNKSFTNNFGYTASDIAGQPFSILFTAEDIEGKKDEKELETVKATGQANDENYVVDQQGHALWCTGESILIGETVNEGYIVKDIVNLQSRKQIKLFLRETEELLESIFDSSRQVAMIILDGSMKIERVNVPFLRLFEITDGPKEGSRLSDLGHPFWNTAFMKKEISQLLINHSSFRNKQLEVDMPSGVQKTLLLHSKIVDMPYGTHKKLFIIIEEIMPLNHP